jgi:hypothetical protein
MSKLKLDVEALTVETFATVAGDGRRGTVLGAGGFDAARETPAEDTGCTAPCMSEESMCEIESCGSTCIPASCWACDTYSDWA